MEPKRARPESQAPGDKAWLRVSVKREITVPLSRGTTIRTCDDDARNLPGTQTWSIKMVTTFVIIQFSITF